MYTTKLKISNAIATIIEEAEKTLREEIETYAIDKEQLDEKDYTTKERLEVLNHIREQYRNSAEELRIKCLNDMNEIYDSCLDDLLELSDQLKKDKESMMKQFTHTDYPSIKNTYDLDRIFEIER